MKRKSIFFTIMQDYFLFNLIITISIVLLTSFFFVNTNNIVKKTMSHLEVKSLVQEDYKRIELGLAGELGGWVEILDKNRKVVYVKGIKQDSIISYSEQALYESLSNLKGTPYYYSIAPFQRNGELHYLLLKIPGSKVNVEVNFIDSFKEPVNEVASHITRNLWILVILFLCTLLVYSYWTARRISRPLHLVKEGLREMTGGRYGTRLAFKAESEFADIRDAFNFMADKLEATEREKRSIEVSKQQMMIDISHDLKTPITSIQGYAKALHEGMVTDEEKKQRYLALIYNKAAHVTMLINTLFQFLKLDDVRHPLDYVQYDFVEFVREIIIDFYEEIGEKGLELNLEIPEKEIPVLFDKKQMSRVLANIISNAIKYNTPGTSLRITLLEENTHISLEIADNGSGIPAELRENIFEPFVRGDQARQSDGGTGLGLSIAKKVVEKHRGSLTLTEKEQEKTIFIIRLPN